MRRVASHTVISRSHRLYRQHHAVRELFTCGDDQDVCDWDFNEDLEFDELHGTTAVEEVELRRRIPRGHLNSFLFARLSFLPFWHFSTLRKMKMFRRLLRDEGAERAFLEKLDIFQQNPGLLDKYLLGSEVSLAVLDLFLTRLFGSQ